MAIPYNLAIHIAMTNGVSPVLSLIAKDMLGLNMSAEKLEKTLNRLGTSFKLMVGGAAAMVGGVEIIKGLEHIANKGEELIHQQNVMLRNGVSYNDVLKVTKTAFDNITKAVPTATAADVLRTVNELRSVTGTMEKAIAMTETSLKIEGLISNSTGKGAEGEGYNIWRSVEDKGIIQDRALTDKMIGLMTQAITATGGKITGSDFFSYARRAKSAWIGDAPESMPEQIMQMQTSGADTAGVERRMFHRMISGGQKLTNKQVAEWERADLLPGGKVLGRDTEQSRPDLFIQGVVEQLEKKGITGQSATQAWADKALNASGSHYFMVGYTGIRNPEGEEGPTRLAKEAVNLHNAQGLNDAYGTMLGRPNWQNAPGEDPSQKARGAAGVKADTEGDYKATMKALAEQWNSLMQAVGGPVAKAAIPIIQSMTDMFNKLGSIANAHPEAIKAIAEGLGYLGVAMIGIGGAAVLAGAALLIPGGAVGLAIAGIGTAIIAFTALHWQQIGEVFSKVASLMASAIAAIPGQVMSAISAMASGIAGAIAAALKGIAAHILSGGGRSDPSSSGEFVPGAYHPPSKTGGGAGQVVFNHTSITNLDGKQIAMNTEKHIVSRNIHSTGASAFDTHDQYAGNDFQMSTV